MTEFERLRRDFGWNIEGHTARIDGVWQSPRTREVRYPETAHDLLTPDVEEGSFWVKYRNQAIEGILRRYGMPRALWEVGAGRGTVARHLQESGVEVVAVEPGPKGAAHAARAGLAHSVCATLEDLNLPGAALSSIGCFDVLEHLEEPEKLLETFRHVLVPGGAVTLTVPAFPCLWSQADDIAGHVRRYTRASADRMMTAAGFARVESRYMMATMVPPLFLLRTLPYRLGRRRPTEDQQRRNVAELTPGRSPAGVLASSLLALERMLCRSRPPPFGTSVLGQYVKPVGAV